MMKSGILGTSISLLAACLLGGCTTSGMRSLGIPWVAQGPGITPEEARAQREGRASADAARARAAPVDVLPLPKAAAPVDVLPLPKAAPAEATPRPAAAARAPDRSPSLAAAAPAHSGPEPSTLGTGYTQAARYGDMLFISGQIAMDLRTHDVAADKGIEEQTIAALENVRVVLEAHRLTMANLVSTTVYLKNINDLRAMDAAYSRFFKGALPARTVVEVSRLPRGALVEISAIAGR